MHFIRWRFKLAGGGLREDCHLAALSLLQSGAGLVSHHRTGCRKQGGSDNGPHRPDPFSGVLVAQGLEESPVFLRLIGFVAQPMQLDAVALTIEAQRQGGLAGPS